MKITVVGALAIIAAILIAVLLIRNLDSRRNQGSDRNLA